MSTANYPFARPCHCLEGRREHQAPSRHWHSSALQLFKRSIWQRLVWPVARLPAFCRTTHPAALRRSATFYQVRCTFCLRSATFFQVRAHVLPSFCQVRTSSAVLYVLPRFAGPLHVLPTFCHVLPGPLHVLPTFCHVFPGPRARSAFVLPGPHVLGGPVRSATFCRSPARSADVLPRLSRSAARFACVLPRFARSACPCPPGPHACGPAEKPPLGKLRTWRDAFTKTSNAIKRDAAIYRMYFQISRKPFR